MCWQIAPERVGEPGSRTALGRKLDRLRWREAAGGSCRARTAPERADRIGLGGHGWCSQPARRLDRRSRSSPPLPPGRCRTGCGGYPQAGRTPGHPRRVLDEKGNPISVGGCHLPHHQAVQRRRQTRHPAGPVPPGVVGQARPPELHLVPQPAQGVRGVAARGRQERAVHEGDDVQCRARSSLTTEIRRVQKNNRVII